MNRKTTNKAVFLDRDGVINKVVYHKNIDKPSSPWSIDEFKIIKGIKKPLDKLKEMGFLLFIISNQPDIARGNIKKGTIEKINKIIYEKFPITEIKTCPHDDKDNCNCRKPKIGMILDLQKKYDIELRQSYIIGDTIKDLKTGENAKITTILIDRKYNQNIKTEFREKSLDDAVKIIYKKSEEK